jgi:hypothetical protein
MVEPYKSEATPLCPIAIKEGQHEVHAPEHETWDKVTCPNCPPKSADTFLLGPNRIYGSRITKEKATRDLLSRLADDHKYKRKHANSYELPD